VVFFTSNPTKLDLHFSDFSKIFYAIYKKQPNALYYLRIPSHAGPWKVSDSREYAPGLRKSPWKDLEAHNWVPRHGRRRLGPKSGEVAARVGGERWGKGSGPHRRPICGLVGGERVAGRGASRLPAAAAAGVAAPARGVAPAAHWDVEQLACESREGTASSEDRSGALGRSSAAAARGLRRRAPGGAVVVGSVSWRGGPTRRGWLAAPFL
jgi:hypothetical protein